ncbi:hypothetical protein [Solimicrobium silvestre]|uniref:MetA-pathway of phenol degradation n=1 Tax=Solimicrobium silvestre TaxID=2099400 RepID=A0A2S9GSI7_9BURK|nr:hypothetical protein [Solimicrobium silvestre]PRC90665.1 hypothetical protein S2091_4615 [Solimicrobium silvestre]
MTKLLLASSFKFITLVSSITLASNALACATCGCSLSPDGALGYATNSGWGISLDDSFINQNQLRSGTGTISAAQVQALTGQEVENQTINRYLTLGLSYSSGTDWNFKLSLPYIDRSHSTYGTDATLPLTSSQLSSASATGLGDIKLIASYQGWLPTKNLGVQVGIKLPSGNYGGASVSNTNGTVGQGSVGRNPVGFGPAGNSGSTYLDTSLNVGNGSTDLILGSYYFQPVSQNFDAFINGQYQFSMKQELNQTGADYRPGNQSNLSFGLRYEADPLIVPQLQINLTHKNADSGALADRNDTAGNVAYLSPGVTMSVMQNTRIYAFLQVPIYSNLSGYQLFPRYTASLGMSTHF